MLHLNPDESFHYEILRVLAHARYGGSDVAEVLSAASLIRPGDFESFYDAFARLARRTLERARSIDANAYPVSARDAFFQASNYFRAADFFLHGNPDDPRINELWVQQTDAFDRAIGLMSVPGQRYTVKADGFEVPVIFYKHAGGETTKPRPTLILGNGYDGAQEEMLHVMGMAALERGYNVLTYEGPGQPSVVRDQKLGFFFDWERVVNPVVDFLIDGPREVTESVIASKIGLMGYSFGGYLAMRAAAFEPRLAAAIVVDGVFDVHEAYFNQLPPPLQQLVRAPGEESARVADETVTNILKSGKAPTGMRWGIEQGIWSFFASGPTDFLRKTEGMTLAGGVIERVQCPVWIGEAVDDQFFRGQPEKVARAFGLLEGQDGSVHAAGRSRYVKLEDGGEGGPCAGTHCHVGAAVLLNQLVLDWFHDVVEA
ncbi:hypothetical protein HK405_007206 [Cladochytrium tenue]|nr:hypothetical protein HK405_007206 [Cladochytrium tenue]